MVIIEHAGSLSSVGKSRGHYTCDVRPMDFEECYRTNYSALPKEQIIWWDSPIKKANIWRDIPVNEAITWLDCLVKYLFQKKKSAKTDEVFII